VKYKNRSVALHQLLLGYKGTAMSLCSKCETKDCTHVIEKKIVSIMGSNKEFRLIMKGPFPHMVIECEGYSE
jgi:hypothetical protein